MHAPAPTCAASDSQAGEWALKGEVPERSVDGLEVATFAGGCFWGTELHFQRIAGVVTTCVGYTQGKDDMPTYQEICTGRTGHTEGIMLLFDPAKCSYQTLCEKLLSTVDPTLLNQVGSDYGTQYRHGEPTCATCQPPWPDRLVLAGVRHLSALRLT